MTDISQNRPIIRMKPGHERRAKIGYPWVYANEVVMNTEARNIPPGTIIELVSDSDERLGVAFFTPHALICIRLLDRIPKSAIDIAWCSARIKRAQELRMRLLHTLFYRLIHAEADGLPGLIVDRYDDVLVMQTNSAGMARLEPMLVESLVELFNPRAIINRPDPAYRTLEGMPLTESEISGRIVYGKLDKTALKLTENNITFTVDIMTGQKTGWFFDHRANRATLARLAVGGSLLDLYSYTGGFGITAAVAGARHVLMADRSSSAIEKATQTARENGVTDICTTLADEGFTLLQRLAKEGKSFDCVVADPPAFVKTRKDLTVGLKAYRKLARLAAVLVNPGGFLFLASCSHNVDRSSFFKEVCLGLARARRSGRLLQETGADLDHPTHLQLPENSYLKTLLFQLD